MSDTELDVSSLASVDEGALVFPSDEGEKEEEAEVEASPIPPPFLVVPEDDADRYYQLDH